MEGPLGEAVAVEVELRTKAKDVIDERTGKRLGDVSRFRLNFPGVEPAFFSYVLEEAETTSDRN